MAKQVYNPILDTFSNSVYGNDEYEINAPFNQFVSVETPEIEPIKLELPNLFEGPDALDITNRAYGVTNEGNVILKQEEPEDPLGPGVSQEDIFIKPEESDEQVTQTYTQPEQQSEQKITTTPEQKMTTTPELNYKGVKLYSNRIPKNKTSIGIDLMNGLIKRGFSQYQAAGIVGNLYAESNFNFAQTNPDDLGSPSRGLVQWKGIRFNRLKEFAGNRPWTDRDVQLDFLVYELKNYYPNVYANLMNSSNWYEASEAFAPYEGYAGYDGTTATARKAGWSQSRVDQEHRSRISYAKEIYDLYNKGKG